MERVPQGGSIGPGAAGGSDMNMNVSMGSVGGGSEGDGTPRETIVGNECHVCGEVTLKTRLHYGGITCYSCRAFFRRACTKKKKDVCKRNNNCDVRLDERKRCGACRYVVCIAKGMKPHLVLNDEEKQQRFKNVHKRKAELESVARIDAEDELDEFTSPRHEPSFGASEAAFGVAGGSGAETRVGFMGEAPSQPKNSRRGAAFSYQQQAHPQVKQESETSLDEFSGHVYEMPQAAHYNGGRTLEGPVSPPFHYSSSQQGAVSPPSQGNQYGQHGAVSPPSSLPSHSFSSQESLVYTPNAPIGFYPTSPPPTSSYPKAPFTSYPTTSYSTSLYPAKNPFSPHTSASWSTRVTSVISETHRAAVMPGTARTSVIMLACKKEEKVQEETTLSPQKKEKEEENEEQWGQDTGGEKEKNVMELEEDLKEMNNITGEEIFEEALEVQEGREEPREDGPLDLTKYSFLYPQTNNTATKKYFSETKWQPMILENPLGGARSSSSLQRGTSPTRVLKTLTSQGPDLGEESSSIVEYNKPTITRKIIAKADHHLDKQATPSPEEVKKNQS